jgi:hypothetical protein
MRHFWSLEILLAALWALLCLSLMYWLIALAL